MKKTVMKMMGLAMFMLLAGAAQAVSVTLDENTPDKVASYIGMDQSDPADGIADNGIGNATSINLLMCGQTKSSKLARGVLMFDVSGMQTVTHATLTIKLSGRAGKGVFNAEPSGDLKIFAGYPQSFGIATGSATAKSFMYSRLFTDTGLSLSRSSEPGWYSFDVTAYVAQALVSGGLVAFRFQMDNDTDLACGMNDYYSIASYRNPGDAPELVLKVSEADTPIIVGSQSNYRFASKN